MEPISAMDVLIQRNPIQQIKYIQIRPAVPPFTRPIVARLSTVSCPARWRRVSGPETYPRMASHVDIRMEVKPNMDTNRKFR